MDLAGRVPAWGGESVADSASAGFVLAGRVSAPREAVGAGPGEGAEASSRRVGAGVFCLAAAREPRDTFSGSGCSSSGIGSSRSHTAPSGGMVTGAEATYP